MQYQNDPAITDEMQDEMPLASLLQWEWPEHIERAIRRLLWIGIVELAEGSQPQDHTTYVYQLIASSPDAPPAVLEMLSNHSSRELLERIAESSGATTETLVRLARHEEPMVRSAVASNPMCPVEVQMELAADESPDVRYAIAENPHVGTPVLQKLMLDDNGYVAFRARKTLQRRNPCIVRELNRSENDQQGQKHRKLG